MHFLPDQYPPTFKKYLRVLFTGTTSYLLSLSFSLAYLSLFCWYTVLMRASASLLPCAMATADPAAQNTIIATIIPILNLELALSRVSMLQYRRDREHIIHFWNWCQKNSSFIIILLLCSAIPSVVCPIKNFSTLGYNTLGRRLWHYALSVFCGWRK